MSRLITITGPAYSGKTTLINHLKTNNNYVIPRHITTRKKRIPKTGLFPCVIDTFIVYGIIYNDWWRM